MASWLSRRPRTVPPRVRHRAQERLTRAERVELAAIVPGVVPFLGQLAYLQLDAFETFSQIVPRVPVLEARITVARAAGLALDKHQRLTAELKRQGVDPLAAMHPFATAIDDFRQLTQAGTWEEALLGAHVSTGILDDFFLRLSVGLPEDVANRVAEILRADDGREGTVGVLSRAIEADESLASLLALWGRRMVGDVLLVARSALDQSAIGVKGGGSLSDDERVEPVLTELIAEHTRRMDALGLTA